MKPRMISEEEQKQLEELDVFFVFLSGVKKGKPHKDILEDFTVKGWHSGIWNWAVSKSESRNYVDYNFESHKHTITERGEFCLLLAKNLRDKST